MLRAQLKTSLTKTREFDVNHEWLAYDGQQMPCAHITGFAYGKSFTEQRLIRTNTHHFKFRDTSGKVIEVAFNDVLNSDVQETVNVMVDAIWQCFGNRIMNEILARLSRGETVTIGNLHLNKDGITYTYKPWFRKERTETVAWKDITGKKGNHFDFLELRDTARNKTFAMLGLVGVYNGQVLASILSFAKTDPIMMQYLTAEKVYLP